MIFVHDSPHQKQNFLNLIVCHIHHTSQLWKKNYLDYHLNYKNTIIQNDFDHLQFVEKNIESMFPMQIFSFCTVKSICMTKWGLLHLQSYSSSLKTNSEFLGLRGHPKL